MGHLLCCLNREIMESSRRPQRYKFVYIGVVLYTWLISYPSAIAAYWAFGETIVRQSNAFGFLPSSPWRMIAIVLMVLHQVSHFPWFSPFFSLASYKASNEKKDSHASIQSWDWPKKQRFQSLCSLKDLGSQGFNCVIPWCISLVGNISIWQENGWTCNPTIVIKHEQVDPISTLKEHIKWM